jgi:hypothetical protein
MDADESDATIPVNGIRLWNTYGVHDGTVSHPRWRLPLRGRADLGLNDVQRLRRRASVAGRIFQVPTAQSPLKLSDSETVTLSAEQLRSPFA